MSADQENLAARLARVEAMCQSFAKTERVARIEALFLNFAEELIASEERRQVDEEEEVAAGEAGDDAAPTDGASDLSEQEPAVQVSFETLQSALVRASEAKGRAAAKAIIDQYAEETPGQENKRLSDIPEDKYEAVLAEAHALIEA